MTAKTFDSDFTCEFIIAGAGPAGASTAYHLAKAGFSVLLLDHQSFPRDKVCGDFVGPVAIKELQEMGITELPEFKNTNIINRATVFRDGQELIASNMPVIDGLQQHGRVIPRKKLDAWIFDAARKAGVNVMENTLVTGFSVEKDRVKVFAQNAKGNHTFCAALLIGADGSNSLIAKGLRGYLPPLANKIIGVRGYYENVEGASDQANMHFASESFPGYCWLFPTGNNEANVGVGVLLETMPKGNQPKELLNQLINQDPGLKSRLQNAKLRGTVEAWPLNTFDPHLPIVGDRVLLVGEAAGLINPLNGEGIQYALLSGKWASETASLCHKNKDYTQNTLAIYQKRVEDELGFGFKISAFIVQLIRNRNLNPLWLKAFEIMTGRAKTDPQYASTAGGILAGLLPTSQGLTPQFMLSTVEEAVISTGMKVVTETLNDPASLPQNVLKITQTGFEVAAATVQNPIGFLQWAMETAAKTAELAATLPLHALKEAQKPTEKS